MATTKEAELLARIAELEGALQKKNTMSFKVSVKGAVSVYGLQRMPITHYAAQWERVLENAPALKAFITANKSKLSYK